MVPKKAEPAAKSKGGGRQGKQSVETQQQSRIDFGLPPALVTSLQAITSRSTQDLWTGPTVVAGDTTLEQQVQRRANAIQKLSRRINGDMKAKAELASALNAWAITISQHLVGLVGRVRALGQKVDEDLAEAAQEMRVALRDHPSASSADQVASATASLGPIWHVAQEEQIYQLAAGLRAFGTVAPVPPPVVGASTLPHGCGGVAGPASEASFGDPHMATSRPSTRPVESPDSAGSLTTLAGPAITTGGNSIPPATPARRWRQKRSTGGAESRPSKSPRREGTPGGGPPWTGVATGRSPEGIRRQAGTAIETEDELIPDLPRSPLSATPSWFTGWLYIMQFAIGQGQDAIGELGQHPEQEASLPMQHNPVLVDSVLEAAGILWEKLQQVVSSQDESSVSTLLLQMQTFLQHVRSCPLVLPRLPQGLLLAVQASLGHLLDPFSYAPSTVQEWLFPGLLLEHGGPFLGFVPGDASTEAHVQMMLHFSPPGTASALPQVDGVDLAGCQDLDES